MAFEGFQRNDLNKDEHSLAQRVSVLEVTINRVLAEKQTTHAEGRQVNDRENRPKDNLTSVSDAVRESMANSSLHGIPHLVNAQTWWPRVIWVACILGLVLITENTITSGRFHPRLACADYTDLSETIDTLRRCTITGCMSLLTIQVISITEQYLSSPVKTNYEIVHDEIALPAVTICNSNPFNKMKIREHPALLKAFKEHLPPWHSGSSRNTWHDNSSERDSLLKDEDLTMDIYDNYLSIMNAFQSLSEEERVRVGYTSYELFARPLDVDRIPAEIAPSYWYGNCYTDYIENVITKPGFRSGYQIVVNLRTEDFIYSGLPYYASLSIHDYGVKPIYNNDWITLNPGHTTLVKLGLRQFSRLGGDYGNCTDGVDFENETGIEYSVGACREFCTYAVLVKRCGCVLTQYMSIIPRVNISRCSPLNSSQVMCNANNLREKFECDCPNSCKENIYSASVMLDIWSNKNSTFWNTGVDCFELSFTVGHFLNPTECNRYFQKNVANVHIYYPDLMHEKITEEPIYDKYRFLSDLGGTIGLYIGASVLTYVELLQFIASLLTRCFRRNNQI